METILPSWEEIGQGFEARTLEFHDASAYWHGLPVHLHGVPGQWELKRYNAPVDSIEDSAWSCLVTLALQAGGKEGLGIVTAKAAAIYWLERLRVTADYKVTRKVKHKQIKDGQITNVFEASARLCSRLHSKNVVQHCVSDDAVERLSKCATFWDHHLKKLHKRGLVEKYRYDWERAADLLVARGLWPAETRTVIDPSEDGLWVKFGKNYFPLCSIRTLASSVATLSPLITHTDTRKPTARLIDQVQGLFIELLDKPDRKWGERLRWEAEKREDALRDEEFQKIISRVPCDGQARARQEMLWKEFWELDDLEKARNNRDQCLSICYSYDDPAKPYGDWQELDGIRDIAFRNRFKRTATDSGAVSGCPDGVNRYHYWLHSTLIGILTEKPWLRSHLLGNRRSGSLMVVSGSHDHWQRLMDKAGRTPGPTVTTTAMELERVAEPAMSAEPRSRPGPRPNIQNAMETLAIVRKTAPAESFLSKLDDICEALDEAGVRSPKGKNWKHTHGGAKSWSDVSVDGRDLVVKELKRRMNIATTNSGVETFS